MAGHSKWANIKRQKARVDAKKGKVFARLSRAIIVAARHGSADPNGNFQLRSAIDKAKAAGIPNENIDRAIAKGSGQLDAEGDQWEEIRYEGYGIGGVALLIEAMTDNRNRTAADLRAAFNKYGGNLGETGCVGWMFHQQGIISILGPVNEDQLLESLVETGADSYEFVEENDQAIAEVSTDVTVLETVTEALKAQDFQVLDAEIRWIGETSVAIADPDQAKSLIRLMDALEDLDDVQSVTANVEFMDNALASL
ncbi:YebC/PmpR family DNA-binding transcriptional regulator [Acaryochloris sp. CCMEE 5410]|uniref:YebC/PmpR family DNA-binding transcriptional regulator n=1 Tax=Acaryochloris sp. CCMEE 5410 TaxID=310037 RepID=UPI0002485119|nr:YebC/PmpR family DNA-binding transcriptional regulator [Acaryochloris sp. CCMEE 5410]KAI9131546.1 YebC/PmpR family DNA-binding transcriptional regulator [Acaryochloris sp. CCMEE 5410]